MGLKDIYNSAEDKYYDLIEAIDKTIPITKITDKIDAVFPSFILILILIAVILGWILLPAFSSPEYNYTIKVINENNQEMQGIKIKVFDLFEDTIEVFETNEKGEINLTAKKGTNIKIEINAPGYKEEKRTMLIEEEKQEIIFKLEKLAPEGPTEAVLRFSDSGGKRITGKEIIIEVSCRNSSVIPSPSIVRDNDDDGEITVSIPDGCEKLMVDSVEAEGYENYSGMINSAVEAIKLNALETEEELLGDLKVIVQDSDGIPLNGIEVNLMKGNSTIKRNYSDSGLAHFTQIEVGSYDLLLQDSQNNYETKKIYSVKIYNQSVEEKIIEMKLTQKGSLKVTVKDKDSGSRIKNADVLLKDEFGEIIGEKNTAEGETIEFALFTNEDLILTARHKDYLPETIEVNEVPENGKEITIEMEKITSENSGKLKIILLDEDEKKVVNARVILKNEDKSIATGYPEKFSDAKGEVNYNGIKEGIYSVRAEKYPASAESESFEIILTEKTEIELKMIIGNAKILVKTINREGNPIPFTRVKIKSLDEEKEFALNENGEKELSIKADKKVFFEFSDPENLYANYTTKEYQLYPEEMLPEGTEITAVMNEQISGQELWVKLKGIYLDGKKQETLVGGNTYNAVFELYVPENEEYNSTGIHIRTGEDSHAFLENDIAGIKKINAPTATKIKGTTWNPIKGEDIDFDADNSASANAEAKWANIVWQNTKPGIYQTEIEIKVKEGATENDLIPIKWRAWGKGDSYYYNPADNDAGSTKQRLYAETYEQVFNTEEDFPVCMENNLCLSKQVLLDKAEEPFIIQKKIPFTSKSNGLYEYSFRITNDSLSVFDEPEIWIKLINPTENNGQYVETEKAGIEYYEIKRADASIIENQEIKGSSTEGIELGKVSDSSVINGKIGIKTLKAGVIFVNISVIEKTNKGGTKIFDNRKETQIKISSEKELEVDVKPELIPAWSETPVKITIKDNQGIETENTIVELIAVEGENIETVISAKKTNRLGETEFVVPKLDPKTKIKFTAKKFGYETGEKEIVLSEEVFEVEPQQINENLSLRDNPEVNKTITLRNLLEAPLQIYDISLVNETGYFERFIDLDKTRGRFNQFVGETIQAFPQEYSAEMFTAELSGNVMEDNTDSARGTMTVSLINTEFNAVYDKEIDVILNLGMGEPIEDDNCLVIEYGETDFSRQTTQQTVQLSYTIINNCMDSQQKHIPLNNLKAKIDWSGSKKGDVSFNIKNRNLKLKPQFEVFSSNVRAEEEMTATLTYEPFEETGEQGTGEFTVSIQAELNTAQGKQDIYTYPNKIKGKIGNIRLDECIEFNPAPRIGITIESTGEDNQFTIKNNCGTKVELKFCMDDRGCRGGTEEGGITLRPETVLQPMEILPGQNNALPVIVERTSIPGIYGITVHARKDASEAYKEIAVYDVIIEPKPNHYFSLNKYEIVVPEENELDIIELYNHELYSPVNVTASVCEWQTAKENNFGDDLTQYTGATVAGGAVGAGTVLVYTMKLGALTGPTGIVLIAVGGVLGIILCAFFCPDPCEDTDTQQLFDYLINLSGKGMGSNSRNPSNLVGIELSKAGIEVNWNLDEPVEHDYTQGPPGKETLPLKFKKTTSEFDSIRPSYDILTVNATRHNQRTDITIPRHENRAKDIVSYGLPDYYKSLHNDIYKDDVAVYNDLTDIQKKFHVRAITKKYIQEIKGPETSLDCVRPDGSLGAKGEKALPKIKLNWNWNEIKWNSCDQNNEDYIYCDASQFNIMLNERMQKIEEFMENNNYSFSCPKDPAVVSAEAEWHSNNINPIENGEIGLYTVSYEFKENNKLEFKGTIQNKTSQSLPVAFTVKLIPPENSDLEEEICSKPDSVSGNSTKEFSCEFSITETKEVYKAEIRHLSDNLADSINPIQKPLYNSYAFNLNLRNQNESKCWIGTSTIDSAGIFPLEYYLNKLDPKTGQNVIQEKIKFNGREVLTNDQEIKNAVNYIKELSHFNAYLIEDGFTQDFKSDFADYYENTFLNSPVWFTDNNPNTTENEMSVYYNKEDLMEFKVKHSNEKQLSGPGLYRIDLTINYKNDRWSLFAVDGKPNAEIGIEFTRLDTPEPNSIFYYLPFDGKIGETNLGYQRIGYGAGYQNLGLEEIKINNQTVLGPTLEGSSPLKEIEIEKIDSLQKMNSDADTRGSILRMNYLDSSLNEMNLKFYSNKATPVVLNMYHKESPNEGFSYYYGMTEQGVPLTAGTERLAYWKGLGACMDFEGRFVQNYRQWDEKAGQTEMPNLYKVSWNNAVKEGNTYFKTIFYTPTERNIELKMFREEQGSLSNADIKNSPNVRLNGISGMQYNNADEYAVSDYLRNIQTVFELIKNGKACIMQNDVSMNVYWNEANLYQTQGELNQSINEFENTLEAGENCIN